MANHISDGADVVLAEVKQDVLSTDAFHRYRVSIPYTTFEFNSFRDLLFSNNFNFFDQSLNGGAITHNNTRKAYVMSCGTASGNYAIAQTKSYWRYQSGKSQLIIQTFVLGTGQANKVKRIGVFDSLDGIFLEQNGTTLNLVVRSSVDSTENRVPQSSWDDPFDGTGPSGLTLDVTKSQIMVIDYQWLGAGRVKIGFDIDGIYHEAYQFNHANLKSSLYMASGSLPLRYEIRNTGTTATDSTMEFMCGLVATEAGSDIKDLYGPSWSDESSRRINTETALIALRLKTTFKSNTNRSSLTPAVINIYSENKDIVIRAYYNPTITGGTWTSVNTDSICEANKTITSFSGGRRITTKPGASQDSFEISENILLNERFSLNLAGTSSDIFLLTAESLSNSTRVWAGVNWKEFHR